MKFYLSEQYQPSCEALFLHYQGLVKKVLPHAVIEHIGASSIPHAVSKGDLDIFIGVSGSELEQSVKQLIGLGFQEKADTLRTVELCMLESNSTDDVAIQVVANGSQFEDFLVFRDELRQNQRLVKQYNELKISCEGWSQRDYRRKKSAFIEQVLSDVHISS